MDLSWAYLVSILEEPIPGERESGRRGGREARGRRGFGGSGLGTPVCKMKAERKQKLPKWSSDALLWSLEAFPRAAKELLAEERRSFPRRAWELPPG